MSTEVQVKQSLKEKLAALKNERARISNEIAKLTDHSTKNERKIGHVYYMHTPFNKNVPDQPRITLAAYIDLSKKEVYYGVRVWKKNFNRKVSRHKALGKALSVKHRRIERLKLTDKDSIREKLVEILERAELTAVQNYLKNKVASADLRVKVANLTVKQLGQNGTH